jgi:hypothetical protein
MQFEHVLVGVLATANAAAHGEAANARRLRRVFLAQHGVFDVIVSDFVILLEVHRAEIADLRIRFRTTESAAESMVGVTSQEMNLHMRWTIV